MNNPKRIKRVIVRTERTLIFRNHDEPRFSWCLECNDFTQKKSVVATARDRVVSELEIYRLIEAGAVHVSEDLNGSLLICINSVL